MAASIKLAIVDDHPLFREGVVRTLEQIGGFEIVAQGSSRDDALRISEDQQLDILLMDISVPGGGLSAVEPALELHPDLK
ncbi:response regulator transcription factor, partial [Mesorhizobium sp.]|uniref:response regulator transcription factor n=1 Tax=Mesorhizobium sp. TaxID=1871066 RepID=UPI0011FA0807